MPATDPVTTPNTSAAPALEAARAAFRELHGRRLNGFALLLTLGDRPTAARLASDALAAGVARIGELRHPERAAAWLRRRVVENVRVGRNGPSNARILLELGVEEPVVAALAALDRHERAALIASAVERLDARDVAVIVGRDGSALDRLMRRARDRYVRAYVAQPGEPPEGPIVTRVHSLARRAMT
jgi:DNA-directed RNA polymerase specialized sigma24 family protein